MTDKTAMDVGHEIAAILKAWRPDMDHPEDVGSTIGHALERYSIDVEGPGEAKLRACIFAIKSVLEKRADAI